MDHGTWKTLRSTFDEALQKLPAALAAEGFGVITQIDLGETLRTKLGKDVGRYRILGACNPAFAYDAVTRDPRVGVLLPCNVVLYEKDGRAVLGAIDPLRAMGDEPAFADLARGVAERLRRALDAVP